MKRPPKTCTTFAPNNPLYTCFNLMVMTFGRSVSRMWVGYMQLYQFPHVFMLSCISPFSLPLMETPKLRNLDVFQVSPKCPTCFLRGLFLLIQTKILLRSGVWHALKQQVFDARSMIQWKMIQRASIPLYTDAYQNPQFK